MTPLLTKSQIRQACLHQRNHLTQQFISQASQKITDIIQTMPDFQTAQHIAWYFPANGEVDLSALWQITLEKNKCCYLPSIRPNHTLLFLPYTPETKLTLNRYQILEPRVDVQFAKDPQELDILFLPVVAFDIDRTRLGMGKGYYDKTLAQHSDVQLIGVAYEWQKQPKIPKDPWDIPLKMIITEEKIYS